MGDFLVGEVGAGSRLHAAGPLNPVDHIEGHSTDQAARHHGHQEHPGAAAAHDLPYHKGDRTADNGHDAGVLGGLGHCQAQAIGREGAGAADTEGEGVHGHDGHAGQRDQNSHHSGQHVTGAGVENGLLVRQLFLAAQAGVQVVDDHGRHAQQVGVGRGHGGADNGGGDQTRHHAGRIVAGDDHHGVAAAHRQTGQLIPQSKGSQAQQRGEDGHGGHQDGGQEGRVSGGPFILGRLEAGDHLRTGQEGAEVVEDIADDGGPADLGQIQLLTGQCGGNGVPAAGVVQHNGGGDGQAHQDDAELQQVGDLVGDHAAHGGIENDDHTREDQAHVQGNGRNQGVDDAAGSGDLRGGQAEQRQHGQNRREVAGELAEPTAHYLGDGHGHGFADLRCKIGQRNHGDGRRQDVPNSADAPVAEGLLGQARGAAAADIVGGQGECYHEQAHAAAGHHVVLGILDLDLADNGAHNQHAHQISNNNNQGQDLNFHMHFSFYIFGPYRVLHYFIQKMHRMQQKSHQFMNFL